MDMQCMVCTSVWPLKIKRKKGDDSVVVRVKIKIKKEGKRRVGDDSLVGDNPGTFNPLPPIILDRPTHRREN